MLLICLCLTFPWVMTNKVTAMEIKARSHFILMILLYPKWVSFSKLKQRLSHLGLFFLLYFLHKGHLIVIYLFDIQNVNKLLMFNKYRNVSLIFQKILQNTYNQDFKLIDLNFIQSFDHMKMNKYQIQYFEIENIVNIY